MENCPFCNVEKSIDKGRIVYQDDTWIAIYDNYPVSQGHVLLIPFINIVKSVLEANFKPNGFNIGANCGKSAGQTVMHCHIHIIPRYDGDMADPRGGVRGVIPEKQKY